MKYKKFYSAPTCEAIVIEQNDVLLAGSPAIYDEEGDASYSPEYPLQWYFYTFD